MKSASKMIWQKFNGIYNCASQRKHAQSPQINDRNPCFNLTFNQTVLDDILKEISSKFIEFFFFDASFYNFGYIDYDDWSILDISSCEIEKALLLNILIFTKSISISGFKVKGSMESYHFLYFFSYSRQSSTLNFVACRNLIKVDYCMNPICSFFF